MKKLFPVILFAALMIPALQAAPLNALQNARIKTQQLESATKLGNIYAAAVQYQSDNKTLPPLAKLDVPSAVLYRPYHALGGQHPQAPDKITDATSGYAYLGEAIGQLTPSILTVKIPFAFEKPGQRPDNKIQVLFTNGKIEQIAIDAENCAGVLAKLKPEKVDEALWAKLAAAAKKIDEAK